MDAKLTSPDEVSIDAEINPKRNAKEKFKKAQISRIRDAHKRQEACERAGYHGEEIESQGGSPQRAEQKNAVDMRRAQRKIDKLNAVAARQEADVQALEQVLATLEPTPAAPGSPSKADIQAELAVGRSKLAQSRGKITGYRNNIVGFAHEGRAAEQIHPDQRNVIVICSLCKGRVTDLDLVKRTGGKTTVYEAKANSGGVDAKQIETQIWAAKALYGEGAKVMLALPTVTDRDMRILREKFANSSADVPEIKEIESE